MLSLSGLHLFVVLLFLDLQGLNIMTITNLSRMRLKMVLLDIHLHEVIELDQITCDFTSNRTRVSFNS